MKILFYIDLPSVQSTLLAWTLCEELRLRGHHVDYGKLSLENYKGIKYDWVFGAGMDSWPALKFARKNGAKCHIHLEGVAYFRIGVEKAIDWGYDRNHTEEEIESFRKQYSDWMSAAFEADSCTVNGIKQIVTIEKMFDAKLPNCYTMCCGVDMRYAVTLPPYPRQQYMITASRLEPAKKVFMIAEALAVLKRRGFDVPPWMIVGYGTQEQYQRLASFCEKNAIVVALQHCYGAAKWYWIKRAQIMLAGWMGIPPAEGIICKTPVLSFDNVDIIEMFDDTIWFAEDNNSEDYADKIEFLLNPENQDEIQVKNDYAVDRLVDSNRHGRGELYANTQTRAAAQYEKIFMGGRDG